LGQKAKYVPPYAVSVMPPGPDVNQRDPLGRARPTRAIK